MFIATGDGKEPESSSLQLSLPCCRFKFSEIQLATENFDESLVIGHGGFGKVYKGNVISGSSLVVAAIKRLDPMSNQGAAEFWAEVEMLSQLRHCHLVSLIGYCNHGKEMILVYEYMPNGTLDDHLHKLRTPLSWVQRLKICIGAGRGLDYLHTGTGIEVGVIHRDVKSSNILLHEKWAAKISDFGLSKIGPTNQPSTYVNTLIKGTFGYLDPSYFTSGRLTRKSDVYAFGVVLFEVLCKKRAVDSSLDDEQWGLAAWAKQSIKEGNLKHIIDSDIRSEISPKCLKEFVRIAERCLHSHPKQRPTMAEVVGILESILTLQEKFDSSLQPRGRTMLGRMVGLFPFPSKGESSAHGDSMLSSNSKGKSGFAGNTADFRIHNPFLKVYTFADLEKATRHFSQDLLFNKGSFADTFIGWVDQNTFSPSTKGVGIAVAVKRYLQGQYGGDVGLMAEVSLLERLVHPNIISILGYCNDKNHGRLIVYEYMQTGTLNQLLLGDAPSIAQPLSWGTRLLIMIGVARGLAYLHSLKDQVLHRDVKSGNIFLDQDINAKLGGFELARFGPEIGETHVTTVVEGTIGYVSPEYVMTGRLSVKSDIYSFGVVLLETLTGLQAMDARLSSKMSTKPYRLVSWVTPFIAKRTIKDIMDPHLEQNYPEQGAFECAALALRCVADNPKDRPSSEQVFQSLEQIYIVNK